ncbi:MAG: helix-turn-helix domain-containing protein [Gammaproteobacteria bacterium]|nr:helix-turn-helix domain-containing protein [Gammaproteobacteria bacterium]
MSLVEIFSQNLKRTRKRAGISQEELASLCGLHRTYIGAVERGERNISIKNIEKISAALNVKASYLLEEQK